MSYVPETAIIATSPHRTAWHRKMIRSVLGQAIAGHVRPQHARGQVCLTEFGKDAGFLVKVPKRYINYPEPPGRQGLSIHIMPRETTQRNKNVSQGYFPGWFLVAGKRPTPELQYS